MKQTILRYGLLSGALASALMVATAYYYHHSNDTGDGQFVGYAGILLSMLFVFFGVRTYRQEVNGGTLTFGKGFQIGMLIVLISSVCYVLTWFVVSETLMPDFLDKFIEQAHAKLLAAGTAQAEIDRQMAEMMYYKELYANPIYRFGLILLEPFPVGFFVALISAIVLRKNNPD